MVPDVVPEEGTQSEGQVPTLVRHVSVAGAPVVPAGHTP